ncbi:MAG: LCP family protein [Lachnospiraceae bacterium]|nr:LCP family protein [Lachnospiraceae bacterium]
MSKKEKTKTKKKKKHGFRKLLIVLLIIFLLVVTLGYYAVDKIYEQLNYEETTSLRYESLKEDGVTNILLIGNDSRDGVSGGRSDAMILLSISDKTKSIHLTSLLRDMYVEIPGYKGNRLNAAYSLGGAELLLETIEENLDIEVNRYVLVDFQAFANLINAVGGVELELTNEEVKWVNAYLNEYNIINGKELTTDYLDESASGMMHLNGPQALAYSRNRSIGNDFGRTERQRKVISAAVGKIPGALVSDPKGLLGDVLPNLTTNIVPTECFSLAADAAKFLIYDIKQGSIPMEGTYKDANIRDMAVLEVDFEANKEYIRTEIYGSMVEEE